MPPKVQHRPRRSVDLAAELWMTKHNRHPVDEFYPRGVARPAAFFDLDKTIIARSSSLAFSRPFYRGGLLNRAAVLRSAYAQFVYVVGGADHDQMEKMRATMSTMVAGWEVDRVKEIVAETLHDLIDPMIYDEAAALIEQHHGDGLDVVIVSSSGTEVVEPIGELLGADHVIATQMVVEDGRYTGDIEFYAYAENKAVAMRRLAELNDYDLAQSFAYSDSFTDLPMLDAVGHPRVVNPDKALRKVAVERDWQMLRFSTPVALRRRLRPNRYAAATVGAVGAAAAAGLVWYTTRRTRPD